LPALLKGELRVGLIAGVVACSSAFSCTTIASTSDRADVDRLEQEARAIARTDGCNASSQCRTAPVGAKACGGPRTYVVYCAATTDSVALFRKLAELEAAERRYNATSGLASDCSLQLPPGVVATGGSCRAAASGP
jgi:hypothetical protein